MYRISIALLAACTPASKPTTTTPIPDVPVKPVETRPLASGDVRLDYGTCGPVETTYQSGPSIAGTGFHGIPGSDGGGNGGNGVVVGGGTGGGIGGPGGSVGVGLGYSGPPTRLTGPVVRFGQITVEGNLNADIVRRIIRRNMGQLRNCYEVALQKNPGLGGVVEATFTIDGDGKVTKMQASGVDPSVEKCIASRMSKFEYPAVAGGGKVRQPMTFSNEAKGQPEPPPPPPAPEPPRLSKASAEIIACLRAGSKAYGVAVVELPAGTTVGLEDSVTACVVAATSKLGGDAAKCGFAFGTQPIKEGWHLAMSGASADTLAAEMKDHIANASGPVPIVGPVVLVAAGTTPMRQLNAAIKAANIAGASYAVTTPDGAALLAGAKLPYAPNPRDTDLIEGPFVWTTTEVHVKERSVFVYGREYEMGQLADALKPFRNARIQLSGDDDVEYARVYAAVSAIEGAGPVEWSIVAE